MPTVTIGKWGTSLAVRIPGEVAAAARLVDGDTMEVSAKDGSLVLLPTTPRFTAEAMFAGRTPEAWRQAYANAYDWGPDVGREVVPDA